MSVGIVPTRSMKRALLVAQETYADQLTGSAAEEYLISERGISREVLDSFRVGVVLDPLTGDEEYRGRITIPYQTPGGTVSIRYRSLPGSGEPKYLSRPGDPGRPFNVQALRTSQRTIYITEGELDAISCQVASLPAVAIPGVQMWQKAYGRLFRWRDVVVLADGDKPGREFAKEVSQHIEGCRIVDMGEEMDVNTILVSKGPEGLREHVGL